MFLQKHNGHIAFQFVNDDYLLPKLGSSNLLTVYGHSVNGHSLCLSKHILLTETLPAEIFLTDYLPQDLIRIHIKDILNLHVSCERVALS